MGVAQEGMEVQEEAASSAILQHLTMDLN